MRATSFISFEASLLAFEASGALSIGLESTELVLSGSSDLTLSSESYSFGQASIPSLASLGGDSQLVGYGAGSASIPSIESEGTGGLFIPVALQTGSGSIKSLYSYGQIKTSTPGECSELLPSLDSKGGESGYGIGEGYLQPLVSYSSAGYGANVAVINSIVYAMNGLSSYPEKILSLESIGQVDYTFSNVREVITEVLEAIQAGDAYTVSGEYVVSINSSVLGTFSSITSIEGRPSLSSSSRVWAVNLDTSSSVQYDNYGYNSFFERNGEYYGVADDGIYKLEGDTDNGYPIEALVELGLSDLDSTALKSIYNVYIAVSSDNKMYLKVEVDDKTYTYQARSCSSSMKNNRVDTGRGLKGAFICLTLINNEGCDFLLEGLTFTPVILSRNI